MHPLVPVLENGNGKLEYVIRKFICMMIGLGDCISHDITIFKINESTFNR